MSRAGIVAALLIASMLPGRAAPATAQAGQAAALRPVLDHIGSVTVPDHYRWMEQGGAELSAFVRSETASTNAAISRLPGRARLERAIAALDAPGSEIRGMTPDGESLFYLRRGAADDVFRLVVRQGTSEAEKILVDPETLPGARPHSEIDQLAPSLDGNYVAYGTEDAGPESSVLRIYDAVRNVTLPERIPGARFASVAWRPDSVGFYYTRPVALGPGISVSNHLGVFSHRLGTDPAQDELVLDSAKLTLPFKKSPVIPRLVIPPGSEYALLLISDGLTPELTVATAPVAQLNMAPAPWALVASGENAVTSVVAAGSVAFLLADDGTRVMMEDLADPGFAHARPVLTGGTGTITGIAAALDALYVARREGAASHLLRLAYNDSVPQEIRLPFDGAIAPVWGAGTAAEWGGLASDPRSAGALFSLQSWNRPLTWLRFDLHLRRAVDLGLSPQSAVDPSRYAITETTAVASDGVRIPLSFITAKGVATDHARPTLIDAYGSFGYAYDPRYMPHALAWAEEGGVFAVCHVRGGGELGEAWHKAGMLANKLTAASDLLACADALRAAGYTDSAHTAVLGTNAGALAAGNAMLKDPGAFRAVLLRSGLLNPVRTQEHPGAASGADEEVLELGSVRVPLQQQAVLSVDPYAQVRDGTAYPAVLLTASDSDPRSVWQAAKMTARLRAAMAGGRPVMLRVTADDGPQGPSRAQREAAWADDLSFLLWQMKAPGFDAGAEAEAAPARKTRRKPRRG